MHPKQAAPLIVVGLFLLITAINLCHAYRAWADPLQYAVPAVNTPLTGCVEGRALRIVNGMPSCANTAPPTLTNCGKGTIDVTATDFIGQVTLPAGLTACTIVMTKLYPTTFVCLIQSQTAETITLGNPIPGNDGTNSTLTVPFGLSLMGAKFGYICGPA